MSPMPNHCIECDKVSSVLIDEVPYCEKCAIEEPRISTSDEFQLFTCKCGKYTGAKNHQKICNRCKDKVTAKGMKYEIQTKSDKS